MVETVLWLFLAVQWGGLQCVLAVFPDHTLLLFCSNDDPRLILRFITMDCSLIARRWVSPQT